MKRPIAWLILFFVLLGPAAIQGQQVPASPAPSPSAAQSKSATTQQGASTQGNPDVQVWVNTNSGVYHCPGTHWYGATKSGVYMKQAEAQQKGYRPAYHRVCR